MYAENYPRFRAPPQAPPSTMVPGGPPLNGLLPANGGSSAPLQGARAPPRGGPMRSGGYDPTLAMGADMAPEDLAKSLQPVAQQAAWYKARPTDPQMMARRTANAASPRGPPSQQYDFNGGGYTGYAPPSAPSPAMNRQAAAQVNGYLPPVKYRRTGEFNEFDDPRLLGGGGGGGPRGPPAADYRANSYDLETRGNAPPPPPQQQQQQMRPPQQRGGYAPYAPPSPTAPRSQQEMMLLARERRRQLEQQERSRFAADGAAYRNASPSAASLSSAAAAWARELDPYDHARRIHRELQPPVATNGAPPQQMHLRAGPSGYANSPGSRIVTPAAALHTAQRAGGMVAGRRTAVSPPRGPPMNAGNGLRPMEPTSGLGYDQLEPVPMNNGLANGSMARGRMPRGNGLSLPPTAAAQMSPQEYNAMLMMERELSAPPDERRGTSRPSSAGSAAGRARGRQGISPGRGPSPPSLADGKFDVDPYTIQPPNQYEMPAPPPELPMRKAPRQSKAPAAREPAQLKKRKESAAAKRKREEADDDSLPPAQSKQHASSKAGDAQSAEPKRRCGRKSMNYSSEQKRERNRAAVKKCRQRQALKYEYLKRKAEVLASENRALSEMLVKSVELDDEKRNSLTRGIQMDILLKIKEIFTQSLPKDFVLDADSIWDLNSVLAVSMPSRCYYGIESIKDFWRTSLRMRNKGKIRSFWAWLFRLPPGDRFAEFKIEPFSSTSNLYFINWTTKSTPALSGSIVIMFGHGHRVTLHVEIFGWLIWRYLLTNTPFPEPPLE